MNHQDGLEPAEARVPRRRHSWAVMTIYERSEQIVAAIPSMVIAVIIVVALVQLIRIVYLLPITQSLSPVSHETFQLVFGMIMTLLIALEFKHSIIKVVVRHENIECAWVPTCNQECASSKAGVRSDIRTFRSRNVRMSDLTPELTPCRQSRDGRWWRCARRRR